MPLSPRLPRPVLAVLTALALPVLAGCGDESGGDPGADPAAIVPARAPAYGEINLKPGEEVTELARKLSGEEDPGAALKRLLEKEVRENDPDFRFSEDVEPWLGDRVGFFVASVSGTDAAAAIVAPTKDPDKAREVLEKELREQDEGDPRPQVVERTHRDRTYLVDTSGDDALAIIDDYAISGNDQAIRAAIDAVEGESLADNDEFAKARDSVEEDGVGFGYVRVSQLLSGLGPQGAAVQQALRGIGETIGIGLDGDESSIVLETASLGVGEAAGPSGPGKVLAQLPASAWAAAGVADLGGRIEQAIDQLSQLGALGGQDPEEILRQLERQLGIDPRRDLAAWMGDVGIFAFGDTPAEFGAALIAQTKDADATRSSIPRLARFLERVAGLSSAPLDRGGVAAGVTLTGGQLPLPVHMALTEDDRFIVALTDQALAQSLNAGDPLSESEAWKQSVERLGEGIEPSAFVNFEPLRGFLDAAGAGDDEDARRVLDGVERLTTLIAGAAREGDVLRGRLVVGVK